MRTILQNPFKMQVTFSEENLSHFRDLAQGRQNPKDRDPSKVSDKRIIQRDNVETHLIGLLGEFAVGTLLGSATDTEAYLSGDTDKDFELYGIGIEVKTLQGYLAFKQIDDFKTDVAVLVTYDKGDYSKVWVQGWISRQDFIAMHFSDNFGYGDRPCMQPSSLHPMNTLKTYCLMTRNMRYVIKETRSTYAR